jgi:hypothetical protein
MRPTVTTKINRSGLHLIVQEAVPTPQAKAAMLVTTYELAAVIARGIVNHELARDVDGPVVQTLPGGAIVQTIGDRDALALLAPIAERWLADQAAGEGG